MTGILSIRSIILIKLFSKKNVVNFLFISIIHNGKSLSKNTEEYYKDGTILVLPTNLFPLIFLNVEVSP